MAVEECDFAVFFMFNRELYTWVYCVKTRKVVVYNFGAFRGADAEFCKNVVDVLFYEGRNGVASLLGDFGCLLERVCHPYVRYCDH